MRSTAGAQPRNEQTTPPDIVGAFARDRGTATSGRLIASSKSWLCHSAVDRTAPLLPWHGAPDVPRYSPANAGARVLDHIRLAWNHAHPDAPFEDQEILVTVPASFDEIARELTIQAARNARFNSFRLIEEPLAAFYCWLHHHRDPRSHRLEPGQLILVCDVGGGTTDFTLIRVADSPDPHLTLSRVAVGRHLILGGDNLDLTLAHHLESKHGLTLEPTQWSILVRQCCRAKETLLGPNPPDRLTLTIPGRGTRLIGSSLQFELDRLEVEQLLVDGFLPFVQLTDRPTTRPSGFREFGLPYAADPAITRHLAEFLVKHRDAVDSPDPRWPALRPDLLLLNGGFFYAQALERRLLDVLARWFQEPSDPHWRPRLLVNPHPDLAVALGAADYGARRRSQATLVDAALGRSYYIELTQPGSTQPLALCLAPADLREGATLDIADRRFELLLHQPAEFPILTSNLRPRDLPGALIPFDPEQFSPLPPIRAVIKSRRRDQHDRIPVTLRVHLSELGVLEVWCHEINGPHRWRLQFDVRSTVPPSPQPPITTPIQQAGETVPNRAGEGHPRSQATLDGHKATGASHEPPPDRGRPVRSQDARFMGIMHGPKAVAASHEPPRSADLQSAAQNMRFMGTMHGRKTVGASHEPALNLDLNLDLGLPVENQTEIGTPGSMNTTPGRKPVPPPQSLLDEESLAATLSLLTDAFAPQTATDNLATLVRRLESHLGQTRADWSPTFLRALWKALLDLEPNRAATLQHESRWLNLLGFALRPGYGCPLDDWRVAQTWLLFNRGILNSRHETCRAEWWILWRRIAPGLTAPQQQTLAAPLIASLRPWLDGAKSPLKNAPHELSEIWRLLGALERLPLPTKAKIGETALRVLTQKGLDSVQGAPLWALARIGARVPAEGPLSGVLPPDAVEPWIRALLGLSPADDSLAFALMQLSRRTGDRYRDIPESRRTDLRAWFASNLPDSPYLRLIEHETTLHRDEQAAVLGDSLPRGLTLATEAHRP